MNTLASSPVARTLDENEQQLGQLKKMKELASEATASLITSSDAAVNGKSFCGENSDIAGGSGDSSAIPNLLSFGHLSPHSPKKAVAANSMNYDHTSMMMPSPTIPAAPPSTPLISNTNDIINPLSHFTLPPSSPLMRLSYFESGNGTGSTSSPFAPLPPPINIRPISPASAGIGGVATPQLSPSHHNHHHYDVQLRQALHATAERERSRIESLTRHESENYSTIEQYQRALAHERRHHSTALALEVTKLSFHTRYTSCDVHAAAEINEEARINNMIKNMTTLKRDMNEDRCRVVMELEREEERIINRLMMRLEEVTREKRLLECQIKGLGNVKKQGDCGGGKVGGGDRGVHADLIDDRNSEHTLHVQFERVVTMGDDSDGADGKQYRQVRHGTAISNAPLLERAVAVEVANDDSNTGTMRERGRFPTDAMADDVVKESIIGSELVICRNNKVGDEGEDDEDEEEEYGDWADEILEGRHHNDSDMEVELENLLKIKEGQLKH
jgi:hypothetical protein